MIRILTLFFVFSLFFVASPTHVLATDANLKCSPSTKTINVGDTLIVDYLLDTRTFQAFGANVIATYTTDTLQAASQSTPVTTSSSWGQPTTNTVDANLGKITLDYGSSQPAWTGSASIGQIQFTAKAAGQAQFNFVFYQPNDDTTPGVAKVWGKKDGSTLSNILTDVNNCIYVIEASTITPSPTSTAPTFGPTCAAGATPGQGGTPCPTNTVRPTVSYLPKTGIIETTVSLLGIGGILVLSGIFLPVFLFRKDND
ncbi:hypothetical protein HYW55_00105 [Candidatus Gottesmanbacteria bacterium]|nr:hypothetical protein [Candidatus Gottesmanbacteria bacterium]